MIASGCPWKDRSMVVAVDGRVTVCPSLPWPKKVSRLHQDLAQKKDTHPLQNSPSSPLCYLFSHWSLASHYNELLLLTCVCFLLCISENTVLDAFQLSACQEHCSFQPAEDTIFEVLFWIVVILSLDGTLPEFLSPHTSRNPCLSRTWELPDSTNVLALALHLPCIPFSTLYTQMKSSERGKVRLRGYISPVIPF